MKLHSWDLPSLAPGCAGSPHTQGTTAGTLCHSSHFGMCPLQTESPQADQVFSWGSVNLVGPEKLKKNPSGLLSGLPSLSVAVTLLLLFLQAPHPSQASLLKFPREPGPTSQALTASPRSSPVKDLERSPLPPRLSQKWLLLPSSSSPPCPPPQHHVFTPLLHLERQIKPLSALIKA